MQIRHPRFESGRRLLLLSVASGRTTSLYVVGSMTLGSTTFLLTSLVSSPPIAPIHSLSRPDCCARRCASGNVSSVPVALKTSKVGALPFALGRFSSAAVTSCKRAWAYTNGSTDNWLLRINPLDGKTTTTYDSTDFSTDVFPLALKDGKGFGGNQARITNSTMMIPESFEILGLNVQLDITHTADIDLDVYLLSPNGTTDELFTDVGGVGDNFSGTILADQVSTSITSGTAPFSTAACRRIYLRCKSHSCVTRRV